MCILCGTGLHSHTEFRVTSWHQVSYEMGRMLIWGILVFRHLYHWGILRYAKLLLVSVDCRMQHGIIRLDAIGLFSYEVI